MSAACWRLPNCPSHDVITGCFPPTTSASCLAPSSKPSCMQARPAAMISPVHGPAMKPATSFKQRLTGQRLLSASGAASCSVMEPKRPRAVNRPGLSSTTAHHALLVHYSTRVGQYDRRGPSSPPALRARFRFIPWYLRRPARDWHFNRMGHFREDPEALFIQEMGQCHPGFKGSAPRAHPGHIAVACK